MARALIVVTNHARFEGTNRATGLWLPDVVPCHDVLEQNGIAVDYVSPTGGFVPLDPAGLVDPELDELGWHYYGDDSYRQKYLARSLSPIQVNPLAYDLIYFAGGRGVMWDFPNNQALGQLASIIADHDGIIAAVGHGVLGLLAMGSFIQDKQLTGPASDADPLRGAGATFLEQDLVVAGRLITGSGAEVAHQIATEAVTQLQTR